MHETLIDKSIQYYFKRARLRLEWKLHLDVTKTGRQIVECYCYIITS